jgi:hypothetical protein
MPDAQFTNGLELTQHLLTRRIIDAEGLNSILSRRIREDLYIDYKHGELLSHKTAAQEVRQYVSGFANAEGGVLIVGMDEHEERPTVITGCDPAHVGGKLEQWANQVISQLIPYLASAPVVCVAPHAEGPVLVIAVDRAPRLVPCTENSKVVHYLRIGDGTPRIDPYLYADLVLGRRQGPELRIVNAECRALEDGGVYLGCRWTASLLNDGLAWVPDWRAGIVGYSMGRDRSAPVSILKRIEILDQNIGKSDACVSFFDSSKHEQGSLPPMESRQLRFPVINLPSPPKERIHAKDGSGVWKGGLYVVPSNGLPVWAQLTARFKAVFREDMGGHGMIRDATVHDVTCEMLPEMERPCISLEYGESETKLSR